MDKLMDNPWFLRFTALFLAIILFISTQAEESEINGKPPGDQSDIIHNIPVKVYYDNENLVVTGIPETVNMTIVGPTNIVQTTKLLQDFTLFVDLNELPMGKHSVEIKSENISEKLDVRFDPAAIDIVIEEKITKIFRVDPDLNDRMLAEDFHIVNMEVLPSEIEVTGAKSVIESISFVKATASKDEGINKSFEQKTRVRVLDKDLNKLNVVISPEEVTVKVDVAEYNKEVPIVLKKRGTPAAGIEIDSLIATETMITLSGPRKVLDTIGEFVVDVDVSAVKGQELLNIDLKKPKGVSSISVEKITVRVEATETVIDEDEDEDPGLADLPEEPVKTTGTKTFDDIQIAVRGLDEKFKSTFLSPVDGLLTLTVKAEPKVIEALKKTDFIVYVDVDATAEEGEQVLTVSVDGPEETSWQLSENEVTMKIELA